MDREEPSEVGGRAVATQARRAAILNAALDAFLDKGLFEATIGDVRARSGASTGSIYHHFSGKEGVAFALYFDGLLEINSALLAVIDRPGSTQAGVEDAVCRYLDWFARNPRWGLFMFRAAEVGFGQEHRRLISDEEQRVVARYVEWLAPRVDAGEIEDLPVELYVCLLVGPSRDFLRRWLADPDPVRLEAAREPLASAAWRALSATPTASGAASTHA